VQGHRVEGPDQPGAEHRDRVRFRHSARHFL
jgi:hypothetical protein